MSSSWAGDSTPEDMQDYVRPSYSEELTQDTDVFSQWACSQSLQFPFAYRGRMFPAGGWPAFLATRIFFICERDTSARSVLALSK